MNFVSDNVAGAAPEILQALLNVNEEFAAAYGDDQWSQRLDECFSAVFEREVRVFTVASGTAANALSLAAITPPWGAVICHNEAHIEVDEAGATEFFSGAKLMLADGDGAKIAPDAVEAIVAQRGQGAHTSPPKALSISLPSERGLLYRPEELRLLGAAARRRGLKVHVDGARFANAVAALGCAPADLSWRAGVDVMSFGATKTGALGAEAVVLFDLDRAEEVARRRKRAGQLISKGRYLGAQWLAFFADGLWLKLAARANALAARLGQAAEGLLVHPVETNQVFIRPGADALASLRAAGVAFYDWGPPGEARLVASWRHSDEEVDRLCALLRAAPR